MRYVSLEPGVRLTRKLTVYEVLRVLKIIGTERTVLPGAAGRGKWGVIVQWV